MAVANSGGTPPTLALNGSEMEEVDLLLEATFEIKNQLYTVQLTPYEIHWKALATPHSSGQYSEPAQYSEPLLKIEKQRLQINKIIAVDVNNNKDRSSPRRYSFTVWAVKSSAKKFSWKQFSIVFSSTDVNIVTQWVKTFNEILFRPGLKRPKSLLVFINPISGKTKALKIFREKVAPLFHLAKITTEVIRTERPNHAQDVLQTFNLKDIDGVVSVGGDGLFSEIVHGLLTRTLKEDGTSLQTIETTPLQPKWRIGIIPAGSTDTVSYSTQGVNDPITSALHIILGDDLAFDVGAVFHNAQFLRYNISFFGYGYYGDTIMGSEQNRWMGPKRYDWEGFKKVLSNRTYNGEISFLLSSKKDSHPRDGVVCKAGCGVCQSVTDALLDRPANSASNATTASMGVNEDDQQWQTVKGVFVAVNSFLVSCRCRLAPDGPAPSNHLGNGCADLVLVHECSRFDYVQHLYRCSIAQADQYDFPFVQVFRIKRFKFRPIVDVDESGGSRNDGQRLRGKTNANTSVWNCDGEIIDEPTVEYVIYPQLIRLFSRGIEDDEVDVSVGCCPCCSVSSS